MTEECSFCRYFRETPKERLVGLIIEPQYYPSSMDIAFRMDKARNPPNAFIWGHAFEGLGGTGIAPCPETKPKAVKVG